VGELHRLQPCRRCRHLFVAAPGERLCPDCRREVRRDRARRALFGGGAATRAWTPLVVFALGSVGCFILAGLVQPAWSGLAGWIGGAAAVAYIAQQR